MKASIPFRTVSWPIAVCSVILLAAIGILWFITLARNASDKETIHRNARRDVVSYTLAYENFLIRTVSQMDQLTMQLKVDWEKSEGHLDLEELRRQGLFTDAAFLSIGIYDAHGVRRTAINGGASASLVATGNYFQFHRNNISTAVLMTLPNAKSGARRQVVFSRRLDTSDDSFAGIVVMIIDADYFTSFYNTETFGQHGLIAMLDRDADQHIEQGGKPEAGTPSILRQAKILKEKDGGATLLGADNFLDRKARFVGWHSSRVYPFVSFVALSEEEVFGPSRAVERDRLDTAVAATLALIAFGFIIFILTIRLASKKAEAEAVRAAYRLATDNANDGFFMLSPVGGSDGLVLDFIIADCNERGATFYNLRRADLLHTRISKLPVSEHTGAIVAMCVSAMETGFVQTDLKMPDQLYSGVDWIKLTIANAGSVLAVTLQDITGQKVHEQALVRLANEDALTGLPNRYWLLNALPAAMQQADAEGDSLALLFVDLDGFKHVNDSQGHAVGDLVLQVAASRLKTLLRPTDHVVRFGGDEFIVVLNPLDTDGEVEAVAQRIVSAFSASFKFAEEQVMVGASVGISVYPRDAADAMTLIKNSDIAMYAGKSKGKGQYRFYEDALYQTLRSAARAKQDLLEAISGDQLILHFQPRVDTRSGRLCSMEALVRWRHPVRGLVPPLEFIPMAENFGMICAIGEIVMQKACSQQAAWARNGLDLVPMSINVSPLQFADGQLHSRLAQYMTLHGIASDLLEVEITESGMMEERTDVLAQLEAIRALGIKLHIDDFGTGYSSLSQLQRLKMDVLKVDRAFTNELGKSGDGTVFFQAIVSMAHALGMRVVAEGVETAEQLAILQTLNCDEIQGYLISRPVPAEEMALFLGQRLLFTRAVAM